MDDEQVWLEEAEYQGPPVHRLRKAPIAAAIAAAATIALVMAMPRSWIERAVFELYVDTLIPAAKLPIGDMGHAVVAFVAAALVAIVAFAIARLVDFGQLLRRRRRPAELGHDGEIAEPRLRRADSHPDAPPRAPFRFGSDFDEDNRDGEDYAAESVDDPAAMTEDGADDEMFDLGGFEAEDSGDDGIATPGAFDVAAIAPQPNADVPEQAEDDAPLVAPDDEIGPLVDVRAKFADMFDPADRDDERDGDARAPVRRGLAHLTTSELVDELERRMATRHDGVAQVEDASPEIPAEPVDEMRPTPAEFAANDDADDAAAIDLGSENDEMDAALQAALGTLARMQQRSAG
jgi:hypothetical protein